MSLKTKLFDGPVSKAQASVIGLWIFVMGLVFFLWASTSLELLTSSVSGTFTATGRLFGLSAVFFALTQFMLMGRITWVERPFGLDKLASYHRFNGYMAITCIIIHPTLIIAGYSLASHTAYVSQYLEVIKHFPYVIWALVAELLFITVVASSIYIVRRKLKFESWYFVHLIVYAAIILAYFHQIANGGSFQGGPLARIFWYALYIFVAINVLFWRFSLPTLNLLRFGWRVEKVVKESPTTTSIYIKAKGINRWKVQAGQFVLVRFFDKDFWWQEHPFSVSRLPEGNSFRLTVRNVGDYTSLLPRLKPGSRVLVSGPFGRFTKQIAQTNKRLFIAGGVGITPIRTLAEESATNNVDSALLYGNRTPDDTVLKSELEAITSLKTTFIYSDAPTSFKGETGRVDLARIEQSVPDYKTRDIYLCGPPPMMAAIVEGLLQAGFPKTQLHYERFALHN